MLSVVAAAALAALALTAAASGSRDKAPANALSKINHIVVIYEENHSFDNLYGGWEGVNGLSKATAANWTQKDQNGNAIGCLEQLDVNLAAVPSTCSGTDAQGKAFSSAFSNAPFKIDSYIAPSDATCPAAGVFAANGLLKGSTGALPGGCTRDIVHRFYQEQYQIDGGKQDRYVSGSDAGGLTMGNYDTKSLPIYKYLHGKGAPHYAIEDNFFQSAFGGSFLNHQYLIAAAAPVDNNAADSGLHSILDANGFPNATYPFYKPATAVKDAQLTQACGQPTTVAGYACGNYGVNTMQPTYQPHGGGAILPPQTGQNIGDLLDAKNIDWAWYAGGWSNANGNVNGPGWTNGSTPGTCTDPNHLSTAVYPNCPDGDFQFHHQPFNYFAEFDPSTPSGQAMRAAHLLDEASFISTLQSSTKTCGLKPVSFDKPLGEENEHPGYASESVGSDHLVELIKDFEASACAKDTMFIVTYDEFGGQWDHVPPPSKANPIGPYDQFGPGTRIPALVFAPNLPGNELVDSAEHDTTSILSTIEHRFGLPPLGTRDMQVNDLATVYKAKQISSKK
ncbi:MAG: phosphoesterase [Actinobacteria bacterium]|nr:phosphoesterase [Actinomycetota bacterium]